MIAGKNGVVLVLSAETAYYLEHFCEITRLRVRMRGRNPKVGQELLDLRQAAMSFDPRALPSAAETEAGFSETVAESDQWLTPLEAADQLDLTDRRVRQMCDSGEIAGAEKVGGRWRISREGLDDYKAARAA